VLIKNVLSHSDELHDGRPIEAYATAEVSHEDFALEHYQCRIRDGLMVVVEGSPTASVAQIKAAIADASEEDRERVKAQFRSAEQEREDPRSTVLDITKPASSGAENEEAGR
jgi:hypothetical protein